MVADRRRDISLSDRERRVLLERCELPADIADAIRMARAGTTIRILPEQLEVLRQCVADQLQRVGFDDQWALTPEGELLESIIDQLQPPR